MWLLHSRGERMKIYWTTSTINDLRAFYNISEERFHTEKKKVRIAIIDNEQVGTMANNLRAAGYGDVTSMTKISAVEEIEKYDLILIDIKGIGGKCIQGSKSEVLEGLAVAEEIKRQYPDKKVIVFSAMLQEYEYNYILHGIVDAFFVKDEAISERNKKIDECIRQRIDPFYLWNRHRQVLLEQGVSIFDVAKLEDKIVNAIKKKRTLPIDDIENIIGGAVAIAKLVNTIADIVKLALQ